MNQSSDPSGQEASAEGYQAALHMIAYEGSLIWTVFSAMLAANAFVVALVGGIASLNPELLGLAKVLPWLGMLLCLAWFLVTVRQFDFYRYWFAWARAHEPGKNGMVGMGEDFSKGKTVTVGGKEQRIGWVGGLFRVQRIIYSVIILFAVIYLGLLLALIDS